MTWWVSPVCLVLLLAPATPAQPPARDLTRTPAPGTASISGIVLTDDTDARPLRRVRVFLNSPDDEVARTTISDDAGRFVFDGLRAARYTVGGTKEGYVTVNYGASRPGRAGAPLTLADGQALADLTLTLPRGAVITGVLLDPEGLPVPGVSMRALRYVYTVTGERRLSAVSTTMASHITDDRGAYRIYGLPAGEYAIAAPATLPPGSNVLLMNDTEVRAALDELKQSQRPQTTSNSKTAAGSETDADAPRAIGYAPVFYPGTTAASQAAVIPLGKSEERAGIDFQLQYVPTGTIRGSVITPEGVSPEYIRVHLIATSDVILSGNSNESRTTSVTAKGEFSFLTVPPGAYTIIAKGTRGPTANASMFWATTELVVDGQSQQEIALSLQPGLTVSGRVVFDGRTPPPDPSRIRVTLLPVLSAGQVSLGTAAVVVDAGGRFTITGITAARYRVQASISGPSGWMLASSVVSGRDVLDTPLDLRQSVDGAVVTFTDRPGELSGVVRDSAGKPMSAHTVILFAPERMLWTPMSRRIRAVPSTADGRFLFRMVAPGEYWLAAVADVDDGEWYNPVLLERLLTGPAVKTTISEGEKKTLDVRIPSP
jgi:carboxypeptidase family protein